MSQVEQIILFSICNVAQQILLHIIKVDKDTSFAENLRWMDCKEIYKQFTRVFVKRNSFLFNYLPK